MASVMFDMAKQSDLTHWELSLCYHVDVTYPSMQQCVLTH